MRTLMIYSLNFHIYSSVNYIYYVVHYIPCTFLFYNWSSFPDPISHLCCCWGQGSGCRALFPGKDPRTQGHPERASPLSCQAGGLILADSPNTWNRLGFSAGFWSLQWKPSTQALPAGGCVNEPPSPRRGSDATLGRGPYGPSDTRACWVASVASSSLRPHGL